jgi:hypothetical protein
MCMSERERRWTYGGVVWTGERGTGHGGESPTNIHESECVYERESVYTHNDENTNTHVIERMNERGEYVSLPESMTV